NKIIFSKTFLRNYIIFGFFVMLWHFGLLSLRLDIPFQLAAVDALVTHILLDFFLLSIWFIVRFTSIQTLTSFPGIVNNVIAVVFILILWLFASHLILSNIFTDVHYLSMLNSSVSFRLSGGILIAALVYLAFFLTIYQNAAQESLKRENELYLLWQKTELQALKNQLNPHFIYNSLNSINALTLYDPEKAREMTEKLSSFLRVALKQDALAKNSLGKEISNIELYLQIEKIRFEEKLSWNFSIQENHFQCMVPALILQPVVENAVKHGVQQNPGQSVIRIKTKQEEKNLTIIIENAFDLNFQRFKGEGVGLENVRNRLKLIYGIHDLLKINIKKDVFIATLKLPDSCK
ncbi:MAG: sensor histidine kinase, partial [Bacteroidota bacterium]